MNKKTIVLLFGGQSAEHEVSINSAKNVFKAIDTKLFEPILIGISRSGCFYRFKDISSITEVNDEGEPVFFKKYPDKTFINDIKIDGLFCLIHGQGGEDGVIQGLLEAYNIPYVGCNVVSSALTMDKEFSKIIAAANGINVAKSITIYKDLPRDYNNITKQIGSIFFMKIANLGSSIGVYKIKSEQCYNQALEKIWRFGNKIIVEEFIPNAQEIEVAILDGKASPIVGEIKPNHEFYSYEAKYLDPKGAELIIPANIPPNIAEQVKTLAEKVFAVLNCSGLSRVDFLVSGQDIYFNEINTIPGFTNNSMYSKLCIGDGLSYIDLITKLINSALNKRCISKGGLTRD